MAENRPVTPVDPRGRGALVPLGLEDVELDGGFWGAAQRRNADATLPHAIGWVNRLGWVDNFLPPGRRSNPVRQGRLFTDSDVYKLVEALVWESARTGDPGVERQLKELTAALAEAQEPDGYLNTYFGTNGPGERWSDLAGGHELYCAGHLIQAGVARLRTHGPDELTAVAVRLADHVCSVFGPGRSEKVCGHPEIEMALVELYRATGERRYLDTAAEFVRRRGHGLLGEHPSGPAYFQDDQPVREAAVLRGHAVRALYLACGAVDVAVETGDRELLDAVIRQWDTTVARRTHLTGGMGSRHADEAFGEDFELPPDRCYAETCAGISAVMLSWRLLLATGEPRFADLIERVLFNVVAASPSADGRSFFYSNTLQRRTAVAAPATAQHESFSPSSGQRESWFAVPCCPTNLTRTFAALATYLATATPRGLQIHQYAAGAVGSRLPSGAPMRVAIRTDYPWHGNVELTVEETDGTDWELSLRVPDWCTEATVELDGQRRPAPAGLVSIDRRWAAGDTVVLRMSMPPRWVRPDARIDALRGTVALQRGPLVYCVESTVPDGPDLQRLGVPRATADSVEPAPQPDGTVLLTVGCVEDREPPGDSWPYRDAAADRPPAATAATVVAFGPYPLWGQRPSTMRVWLPDRSA